ncbi:MAG: SprT family zinc-dependent metalloprotease [Pseudomonadota bacterium]
MSAPTPPLRCPQLSLFDAPAEDDVPSDTVRGLDDVASPRRPVPLPSTPPMPMPSALPSPAVTAPAELQSRSLAVTPDASAWLAPPFVHPLADSRIELRGCTVAYALRRARRRSIGLLVGLDGLRVSAPRWATRRDIETALNDKADWIVRKLVEQRERAQRLQAAQVDWCAGASLPYLGRPLQVQLGPGSQVLVDPTTLHLGLPATASATEIQGAVVAWLKREALALFAQRCDHFAPLLNVRHTQLRLSSAQTRWGSAHASGTIRLNWRLVHFDLPVIDYVVAHELAHLREMNHSPRFWALVDSVVPGVEAAQRVLKDTVLPVWR